MSLDITIEKLRIIKELTGDSSVRQLCEAMIEYLERQNKNKNKNKNKIGFYQGGKS